jgi:carbon starvation protein CstA
MTFVNFDIVWRYFSWTNQTLAVFTLWTGTVWLYKNAIERDLRYKYGYLLAMVPAVFMTMVCSSYIFIAPEGFDFAPENRWIAYAIAVAVSVMCIVLFMLWKRSYDAKRK